MTKFIQLSILIMLSAFSTVSAQAKHDLYGVWSHKTGLFGDKSGMIVNQMITDSKGNVYTCGRYYGTASLSDNTCVSTNSGGYPYGGNYNGYTDSQGRWNDGASEKSDGFVTKYDDKGNWLWSVTVQSLVWDNVLSIALSPNENDLVFLTSYGNQVYSGIAAGTPTVTYGNGASENLTLIPPPPITLSSYALIKISTTDGAKGFQKYLGGGGGDDLRIHSLHHNIDGHIYVEGVKVASSQYQWHVWKYDFEGNLKATILKYLSGTHHGGVSCLSKNKTIPYIYALVSSQTNSPAWKIWLAKTDLTTNTSSFLSYISFYDVKDGYYYNSGIIPNSIDVNNANTHLFVAGRTMKSFKYEATGTNIANGGGNDGIIVCYDPQNNDETSNIRWMVNIRAAGDQEVMDTRFDEQTQTLITVGYIDQNEVDFNPLGTAMKAKATSGKAMFYAVYDLDGKCVYLRIIDAPGDDLAKAVDISSVNVANQTKEITVFGEFASSPFQTDPSNLLPALRTAKTASFITRYSTDVLRNAVVHTDGSYSAANTIKASYGTAQHSVQSCLKLGDKNAELSYIFANTYLPKPATGLALGANPNYDGLQGSLVLNTPAGGAQISVKATNAKNTPAYLAAWIDFNDNGVFDANEVSTVETIPANTNTSTVYLLKWTQFPTVTKAKLQTMMRIRLSSDLLDGTFSQGEATDGEVEDYNLSLDLLTVSKSATVNRAWDKLELDDQIEYTLTVKSAVNTTIDVFDPIPSYTAYITGSASTGGVLSNVSIAGKTKPAIVWANQTLTAGIEYLFKFKAVVNQLPSTSPAFIHNVGFAKMNGDTIPSTDVTCNTLPMALSGIKAYPDYVSVWPGKDSKVPFLNNDKLGSCVSGGLLTDTIKSTWNHIGNLTLHKTASPSDTSVVYRANAGKYGVDSLQYYIKCGADSSAAKIYFLTHKPLALEYYACAGASVELGFTAIAGVAYTWYPTQVSTVAIATGNTINIVKGSVADIGTWWVEAVYNKVKYPRVQVSLLLGDCGVISDCGKDGTVIFKEDFGGNELSDPQRAPGSLALHPLQGKTTYKYVTRTNYLLPSVNEYGIMKNIKGYTNQYWAHPYLDDHTSFGDEDKGYFLTFDANVNPGTFYEFEINDLCTGSTLSFSAWLMNINPVSYTNRPEIVAAGYTHPNVSFLIQDENGVMLANFSTSDINVEAGPKWVNYGFKFTPPPGISKVKVSFINNQQSTNPSGYGNDIALDDIEVRFCAPPVNTLPAKDTTVCVGDELDLKLAENFVDLVNGKNTFGNNLAFRWEHKPQGATAWTSIHSGTSSNGIITIAQSKKTLTNIQLADQGYYRFLVASPGNIESKNCRAVSDSFAVKIPEKLVVPDVRVQLCPDPSATKFLNLSSYLHPSDTTMTWKVKWGNVSPAPYTPAVDPSTGKVNLAFSEGTHTYKYKLAHQCGDDSARFYVTTLRNSTLNMPPQRVVVCKDMAHSLHIQQMLGVEAKGVIGHDLTLAQAKLHLATISGLPFTGAMLFNGYTAYYDPLVTKITYKGTPATKVTFSYTVGAGSCLVPKTYTLEVIITENILN